MAGAGVFSYIVGNAEQFFIDFQGVDVEMQDKIDEVTRLLFEAQISKTLRARSAIFPNVALFPPPHCARQLSPPPCKKGCIVSPLLQMSVVHLRLWSRCPACKCGQEFDRLAEE